MRKDSWPIFLVIFIFLHIYIFAQCCFLLLHIFVYLYYIHTFHIYISFLPFSKHFFTYLHYICLFTYLYLYCELEFLLHGLWCLAYLVIQRATMTSYIFKHVDIAREFIMLGSESISRLFETVTNYLIRNEIFKRYVYSAVLLQCISLMRHYCALCDSQHSKMPGYNFSC